MPANDYLFSGSPTERESFLRLSAAVDANFVVALGAPYDLPEERILVQDAYLKWKQARALSDSIFSFPDPVGDSYVAAIMKHLDAETDEVVDLLSRAQDLAHQETDQQLTEALRVEERAVLILLLVSGASLALAIAAGGFLSRRVFAPISILEAGARRLGGGEISYRIPLNRRDELGQVARAFNDMAERLKQSQEALAGGVDVAERIRSAIENVRVTLETGEAVQITVSIGVVAFPLSGAAPRSEERLIAEADRVLYIAKNNGRNRVWASQTDNLA